MLRRIEMKKKKQEAQEVTAQQQVRICSLVLVVVDWTEHLTIDLIRHQEQADSEHKRVFHGRLRVHYPEVRLLRCR